MEKQVNVIVLGSSSLLGADIIELFNYENNVRVIGYSHKDLDITKNADILNVFEGTKGSITHVINCVAISDIKQCENEPRLAFKINSESVKNLSEVCLKEQIHLTHVSCDNIFEGLKKEPYLEQDETIPLNVYGKSKLAGEGFVRNMGNKGLVIRSSSLYGKHKKNLIDTLLNKLDLAIRVKVVSDIISCPTYTMDLANTIIQLALNYKSGVFNVVNAGQCSMYEFTAKAAEYMKLNKNLIIPIKYSEQDTKIEIPKYSALSTNRIDRTLPEPVRKWEDALYQFLIETKRLYEY